MFEKSSTITSGSNGVVPFTATQTFYSLIVIQFVIFYRRINIYEVR